ncbi:hypothetical protein [Musicola paradisiaca]|uniref:Uncharacterized protein n=1 Tax=Musicola paradisiaca (strain Ech703) TaxID=579405 RepID=C6CCG2_MUSP7|nr:hypothetical protein [Musicola paradisiaca]ACS84973.1 conserved hypothetical protein [Musicola paradisiaca Ech703]
MTTRHSASLSYRHLRYTSRWGWLLALCWLLLNTQLAVASHACSLSIVAAPAVIQHQAHTQPSGMTMNHNMADSTPVANTADAGPLCDKHCLPDSASQDTPSIALLALPTETELQLALPASTLVVAGPDWFTPPVIGPPAEIRFCRFRE